MNEENKDYYVYVHRRKDNGVVFYVGHGRLKRINTGSKTKTKDWISVELQAGGHTVEKLVENLSKTEANLIEHDYLVNPPENWNLVNKRLPVKVYDLNYEYLNARFEYSEDSRTFLKWKGAKLPAYNGRDAGGLQGTGQGGKTYYAVRDGKKLYLIHRVIWILHNKSNVPNGMVIDHIDGNPLNNKICNLRAITQQQNSSFKNTTKNTSGAIGVAREKKISGRCYWVAIMIFDGVKYSERYSVDKYGELEAKNLAINKRLEFERMFQPR